MANVTIDVRGNAGGGGGTATPPTPSTPGGASGGNGGGMVPSNDRMIEDVRREMRSRGILVIPGPSQMSQIINQYRQTQSDAISDRISEQYAGKRQELLQRRDLEYEEADAEIERRRKERYEALSPSQRQDPLATGQIDYKLQAEREGLYQQIERRYKAKEGKLGEEEASERTKAETDLTAAMKDLVKYFKDNEGDNPDSYINQLRAQQRELIQKRDNAATEEEAMSASRDLAGVNEKLRNVMSGGQSQQGDKGKGLGFDPLLLGTQGVENFLGALQSGDIGGAITGGTSAITGLLGAGMKTAMRANAIAAIVAGGYNIAKKAGQAYEGLGGLAALRVSGSPGINELSAQIGEGSYMGYNHSEFGLNNVEFADEIAKRSRARGTANDWYNQSLQQIGLERALGISKGALESGSRYDIYGTNVTDAISQLVTVLSGIKGSGVSTTDFTRVQEKYDIQQQIMGSYMGRADKPSYDVANTMLAAFSAIKGITQDSRIGGEIQSFQDMIRSPKNERMKSLIYGTVGDLFPETGGRMDLIDKALNDPKNEGKIMQAVVQRLTRTFGGMETQTGYFAFKELFPNIAPDRLEKIVSQIAAGDTSDAGRILREGFGDKTAKVVEASERNKMEWFQTSTTYTSSITKLEANVVGVLNQILTAISGGKPSDPQPKPGGNK